MAPKVQAAVVLPNAPIGYGEDSKGARVDITATPAFFAFLLALYNRSGGGEGVDTTTLVVEQEATQVQVDETTIMAAMALAQGTSPQGLLPSELMLLPSEQKLVDRLLASGLMLMPSEAQVRDRLLGSELFLATPQLKPPSLADSAYLSLMMGTH